MIGEPARARGMRRSITVLASLVVAMGLAIGAAVLPAAPAAAAGRDAPGTLVLQTVPALAGVPIRVAGKRVLTDSKGVARVPVSTFVGLQGKISVRSTLISKDRIVVLDRVRGNPENGFTGVPIEVGLRTKRLVSWEFLRPDGMQFPFSDVTEMTLKSNTGERVTVKADDLRQPHWLAEMRVIQTTKGLEIKESYWVVETVMTAGTSAVNRSQQRFVPAKSTHWQVRLLLYRLSLSGKDLLFSRQRGNAISVQRPDGVVLRVPNAENGIATVKDIPRGSYQVKVVGGGISFIRPVSVSRDTEDTLPVISYLDMSLILGTVLLVAIALIVAGRPHLLSASASAARRGVRALTVLRGRRPRPGAMAAFGAILRSGLRGLDRLRHPVRHGLSGQDGRLRVPPVQFWPQHETLLPAHIWPGGESSAEEPAAPDEPVLATVGEPEAEESPAVEEKVASGPQAEAANARTAAEPDDAPTEPLDHVTRVTDVTRLEVRTITYSDDPSMAVTHVVVADTSSTRRMVLRVPKPGESTTTEVAGTEITVSVTQVGELPAAGSTGEGTGGGPAGSDPGLDGATDGADVATPDEAGADKATPLAGTGMVAEPPPAARRAGRRLWRITVAAFVVMTMAGLLLSAERAQAAPREAVGGQPAVFERVPDGVTAGLTRGGHPTPVLAYYYIWFNPTSWNRAKIDYPLLGRYDSDDPEIMRRHIVAAKDAGIDGFLVSWKHVKYLDDRLRTLVGVARAENFSLGIVYQGLDFYRQPLPLDVVKGDLEYFADNFGDDPVFQIFARPLVIWTGSYHTPPEKIGETVQGVRDRLMVLGAARSVEDYEASARYLDGEAYYWSSVDPTQPSALRKMRQMADAVRRRGGLWIAPAAPGYDGRPLGGIRVVDRNDGATLRESLGLALASNPDAIGLISWNEFSENTYVEPSKRYGERELQVLADFLGVQRQVAAPTDSSETIGQGHAGLSAWGALVILVGAGALLFLAGRGRRRRAEVADVDELLREIEQRGATTP